MIVVVDEQLAIIAIGLCLRIESRHYFRSTTSSVAPIYNNCMHFDRSDGSDLALACIESNSSDCSSYFDHIDPFAGDYWLAVANFVAELAFDNSSSAVGSSASGRCCCKSCLGAATVAGCFAFVWNRTGLDNLMKVDDAVLCTSCSADWMYVRPNVAFAVTVVVAVAVVGALIDLFFELSAHSKLNCC